MNTIILDLSLIWQDRLIWMGIGAGVMLTLWIFTSVSRSRKRKAPMRALKKKFEQENQKWTKADEKDLQIHNQKVKELTSNLLLKCTRLLDGDFAEAAFIYYLWESKGGKKDNTKDWEFRKLIEKGQDILKMIFTSYNNLTITNLDLYKETTAQIGQRWERLFVWIRGNQEEIVKLDEDAMEDFFNITQFVSPYESEYVEKKYPLDIQFKYLTTKQVSQEYNDLLGKIATMKNYIDRLK